MAFAWAAKCSVQGGSKYLSTAKQLLSSKSPLWAALGVELFLVCSGAQTQAGSGFAVKSTESNNLGLGVMFLPSCPGHGLGCQKLFF